MIVKRGMEHWEHKVYKVCINDDPWLTLTNLTDMSYLACFFFSFLKLILGPDYRTIDALV